MATASARSFRTSSPISAIFLGGLLAGIGDLSFAFVFYGMRGATRMRVMQSIASGLLGRDRAIAGGWKTALLGVVLHFTIATVAAAVYFVASRLFLTVRQAVICGMLYGIVIYGFMNAVVLPLAGIGTPSQPSVIIPAIFGHMLLVGLPIGLAVKRFSR
ncbi:MAG TPA: hypothetical protein VFC63_14010 [Blastocatellia bacterium]|nr:hypothetical protein [Blastocatellia bacterium]